MDEYKLTGRIIFEEFKKALNNRQIFYDRLILASQQVFNNIAIRSSELVQIILPKYNMDTLPKLSFEFYDMNMNTHCRVLCSYEGFIYSGYFNMILLQEKKDYGN